MENKKENNNIVSINRYQKIDKPTRIYPKSHSAEICNLEDIVDIKNKQKVNSLRVYKNEFLQGLTESEIIAIKEELKVRDDSNIHPSMYEYKNDILRHLDISKIDDIEREILRPEFFSLFPTFFSDSEEVYEKLSVGRIKFMLSDYSEVQYLFRDNPELYDKNGVYISKNKNLFSKRSVTKDDIVKDKKPKTKRVSLNTGTKIDDDINSPTYGQTLYPYIENIDGKQVVKYKTEFESNGNYGKDAKIIALEKELAECKARVDYLEKENDMLRGRESMGNELQKISGDSYGTFNNDDKNIINMLTDNYTINIPQNDLYNYITTYKQLSSSSLDRKSILTGSDGKTIQFKTVKDKINYIDSKKKSHKLMCDNNIKLLLEDIKIKYNIIQEEINEIKSLDKVKSVKISKPLLDKIKKVSYVNKLLADKNLILSEMKNKYLSNINTDIHNIIRTSIISNATPAYC